MKHISKLLNFDQKNQRMSIAQKLLDLLNDNENQSIIITMKAARRVNTGVRHVLSNAKVLFTISNAGITVHKYPYL